jgi:hypothetical protein
MSTQSTALVASSSLCGELVKAERRDSLRADLMALADDLDRHREIARLFATADGGDLPPIVAEYLAGLPAAFEQLCAHIDELVPDTEAEIEFTYGT